LKHRTGVLLLAVLAGVWFTQRAWSEIPAGDAATRRIAHDVFKELIEINTTDSVGNTTLAANAMAKRLLDAGFAQADVVVMGPNDRKGNMVARYRGRRGSKHRPILIIGHTDVVEARREDWSTDPFQFIEKDGYYYGRGTEDMKVSDAIVVADLIRMKKEGYIPDRDIILALTADEEIGGSNGVDWLLKNHRELIDAEYALNPDSHSSLPRPDNAIYHIADALAALQRSPFPFELNAVTREFFTAMARIETGQTAADMHAILANPPEQAAVERLSQSPRYNSTMRTTCVATMLSGGHSLNALPQRAAANVNCRILPGHSQEEIRLNLVKIFNDPALSVRYLNTQGELSDHGSDNKAMTPPPLRDDVMKSLRDVSTRMWPGTTVIPIMETGASDSIYTMNAGIASYGISGVAIKRDDSRAHGRDERVGVGSFYDGLEFYYLLLKELTGAAPSA